MSVKAGMACTTSPIDDILINKIFMLLMRVFIRKPIQAYEVLQLTNIQLNHRF